MIHALTELIATHLGDATHGVNALLSLVPKYATPGAGSDADVDDTVPNVGAIYSEFQADWIAQDGEPPVVPSLTVFAASDADLGTLSGDHETRVQMGVAVTIAVLYVSRQRVGARARREASYTCRAVKGSLVRLKDKVTQSNRTLRGITLVDIDRLTEQRLSRDVGQGSLAGMILARVEVIDSLRL